MMKKHLFLIFALVPMLLQAQQVRVINSLSLQAIENVSVHSKLTHKTYLTDFEGDVKKVIFSKRDTLFFSHPFYRPLKVAVADLAYVNYTVRMRERSIMLDEVVVSVSKWEQLKKEVPNKVISMNKQEVQFSNPQTSADLLSSTGQVFVQKSQMGGGSPMLRGFAANAVLIVVDGVRMNNAIYRSGNLQNVISLDPAILEKTEVIFGPGSVIYGSDALGGVMNFSTKKPELSNSDRTNVKANALTRYATANLENTAHFDINVGFKKFASLSSFTYSHFSDLKTGSVRSSGFPDWGKRPEYVRVLAAGDSIVSNSDPDRQVYSGYGQQFLLQKFIFKPGKNFETGYNFQYATTTDIPRYDRLVQYAGDKLKYAEWYYGPQKWQMHQLYANYSKKSLIHDEVKFIFAWQNYQESRHSRKLNNPIKVNRFENVNVASVNLDFEKDLSEKTNLFYGMESVYNHVTSTANSEYAYTGATGPASTRYPDGGSNYRSSAIYINVKNNRNRHFTFLAGARYNLFYIQSKFIDTTYYNFPFTEIEMMPNALNGGISMVYRPDKTWQLNYNLSSGFRAPNIDDLAKIFDSEPGVIIVPNEDLKPEYTYNADFSVIKKVSDKFRGEITLFYTHLNNAMVRRDFTFSGRDSIFYDGELSKVEALVNAGEAFIAGGSFNVLVDLGENMYITSSLTYSYGMDQTENIPLRHVPPLFGNTSLVYKSNSFRVDIYSNYSGRKDFNDMAPSEQSKSYLYAPDGSSPAWYTLNIKSSYQVNQQIQINLGVENILDHHYRTYSSGISAPGRNIYFALRASI